LIGAEGTLGVVTAATLKLFPILVSKATAFIGVDSPQAAVRLLADAKAHSGGAVEAFELMGRLGIDFVLRNITGSREPLADEHPWYVLAEFASGEPGAAEAALQRFLEAGVEAGLVRDAAIAQNEAQARAFWALRENQSPAQKPEGATWKHDIATPVSRIADFIDQATAAMAKFAPGARVAAFGHVGDGNIHFDVLVPGGGDNAAHSARRDEGSRIVHDIAVALGGSISAEHGLGAMKTEEGARYKSAVELAALRAVRQALDPKRIMNPRVLF
jgi:FAD/FMN-containing dehydrogenase